MRSGHRARTLSRAGGRCSPSPASSGKLAPVERGVGLRDDRPCVRVGGRFAGEVSGVELLEGGVDVVEVEHDELPTICSSALISTMSSNSVWNASARGLDREAIRLRARRSPRVAIDGRRHVVDPEFGDGSHVRDLGISSVSDSGVHDPSTIVDGDVLGQYLCHRAPVTGREVRPEALVHLACRVFQPRRRTTEFVEPRERGVEVCLVEHLDAVDQIAVDRH